MFKENHYASIRALLYVLKSAIRCNVCACLLVQPINKTWLMYVFNILVMHMKIVHWVYTCLLVQFFLKSSFKWYVL